MDDDAVRASAKQAVDAMPDDVRACLLSLMLRDRGYQFGVWHIKIDDNTQGRPPMLVANNNASKETVLLACDGSIYGG